MTPFHRARRGAGARPAWRRRLTRIKRTIRNSNIAISILDLAGLWRTRDRRSQRMTQDWGLNTAARDFRLIVSLTTHPARMKSVVRTIETILAQTLLPDQIVLYLATDEVASRHDLPRSLLHLETRGLSIEFIENVRAHNKYRHAVTNYPDALIVTVDDDIIYPADLLETLYESYRKYPRAISAMRGHRLCFDQNVLLPYNEWEWNTRHTDEPSMDILATGVGGVLYPPGILPPDALCIDSIRRVALAADDIWLKFFQIRDGVPVVLAGARKAKLTTLPGSQQGSLSVQNVGAERNDIVIRSCMEHLGYTDDDLRRVVQDR